MYPGPAGSERFHALGGRRMAAAQRHHGDRRMTTLTLGIVLPLYNERSRVARTFDEVLLWAHRKPHWQFLLVDDGSLDGGGEELRRLHQERPAANTDVLVLPANVGKCRAIRRGFAQLQTDRLCFTDGDLAFSLDHVERLEIALDRFDVVIGNRNLVDQHENSSLRRRLMGGVFNRLARVILDLPYHDTQAGLKGFRAPAPRAIFARQRIASFGFDAELLCIARTLGFTIGEIPARVLEDHSYKLGKVKLLKDSLLMLGDLFRIQSNLRHHRYA